MFQTSHHSGRQLWYQPKQNVAAIYIIFAYGIFFPKFCSCNTDTTPAWNGALTFQGFDFPTSLRK